MQHPRRGNCPPLSSRPSIIQSRSENGRLGRRDRRRISPQPGSSPWLDRLHHNRTSAQNRAKVMVSPWCAERNRSFLCLTGPSARPPVTALRPKARTEALPPQARMARPSGGNACAAAMILVRSHTLPRSMSRWLCHWRTSVSFGIVNKGLTRRTGSIDS